MNNRDGLSVSYSVRQGKCFLFQLCVWITSLVELPRVVHFLLQKFSMLQCMEMPKMKSYQFGFSDWWTLADKGRLLHKNKYFYKFLKGTSIAPVWPDLAKYRHLGKLSKILGKLLREYLVFRKIVNLLWQIFMNFGQIWIVVCSQIMKNILAIW